MEHAQLLEASIDALRADIEKEAKYRSKLATSALFQILESVRDDADAIDAIVVQALTDTGESGYLTAKHVHALIRRYADENLAKLVEHYRIGADNIDPDYIRDLDEAA